MLHVKHPISEWTADIRWNCIHHGHFSEVYTTTIWTWFACNRNDLRVAIKAFLSVFHCYIEHLNRCGDYGLQVFSACTSAVNFKKLSSHLGLVVRSHVFVYSPNMIRQPCVFDYFIQTIVWKVIFRVKLHFGLVCPSRQSITCETFNFCDRLQTHLMDVDFDVWYVYPVECKEVIAGMNEDFGLVCSWRSYLLWSYMTSNVLTETRFY